MRPLLPLLLLLLAGPALAQAPADLAARLPEQAGGWQRRDVTDFEGRPGGAGLGAAAEYRPVAGPGVATVFLYRRPGTVEDELRRAQDEIAALAPMRQYRVTGTRDFGALPSGARCVVVDQDYGGGQRAESFACIAQLRGWTVKLRLSWPAGSGDARPLLDALGRGARGVVLQQR